MLDVKKVYDKRLRKDGMIKSVNEATRFFKKKYYSTLRPELTESIKRVNRFIPGSLYTFDYLPISRNELEFYDMRPLLLSVERREASTGIIESGINLNMFPPKTRMYILETVTRVWANMYDLSEKNILSGKDPKPVFFPGHITWSIFEKVFDSASRIGFKFAVRNYRVDRIRNPRLISLEDWEAVLFAEAKALVGTNPGDLRKLYESWRRGLKF